MYQFSYSDVLDESPLHCRSNEYEALQRSIEIMREADVSGPQSVRGIAAVYKVRQLWSILIEEVVQPDNHLPEMLRAQVISIGLWVFRELEDIRSGKSKSFKDLIEISEIFAAGLK